MSIVYFVRIGQHVKIGFTTNMESRLVTFRNSALDVQVLLTLPGGRDLERRLHSLFREQRIQRELFRDDARIYDFIRNVEYSGLDRGLKYLEQTLPHRRAAARQAEQLRRVEERRLNKAQLDAHFASMVAERKQRLGW